MKRYFKLRSSAAHAADLNGPSPRYARPILKFAHAQEGIAYLEFALCLPFLLLLLMGSVEITRYILIVQKVEKVAVTLSDVTSQGSTISSSQLATIIYAASQVMLPYTFGANGYVIISSVTQTGTYAANNPPIVNWQYTSSGSNGSWTQTSKIGTVGGPAALPTGMILYDKDNVIVSEVFYHFTPLFPINGVIGNQSIYKTGVYKPRLGALSTLSALPYFWLKFAGAVL